MSVIRHISDFFHDLFGQGWIATVCEDPPDQLRMRRIYLVGDEGQPWSAALVCPCGCGAPIQLSLVRNDSPSWSAHVARSGAVTLHPSVWRTRGCRSHFFIRHGRVVWAVGRAEAVTTAFKA